MLLRRTNINIKPICSLQFFLIRGIILCHTENDVNQGNSSLERKHAKMSDCIDFGVIPNIEYGKDYSCIGGPDAYKVLYKQYHCISIPDDIVGKWIHLTYDIPTFLCSLNREYMGVERYGVTIIPPKSAKKIADIVCVNEEKEESDLLIELINMLNMASNNGYHVICYGI